MIQQYAISGLHCPACEKKVEDTLMKAPGITKVIADKDIRTLLIHCDRQLELHELNEALELVGDYQVRNHSGR